MPCEINNKHYIVKPSYTRSCKEFKSSNVFIHNTQSCGVVGLWGCGGVWGVVKHGVKSFIIEHDELSSDIWVMLSHTVVMTDRQADSMELRPGGV